MYAITEEQSHLSDRPRGAEGSAAISKLELLRVAVSPGNDDIIVSVD